MKQKRAHPITNGTDENRTQRRVPSHVPLSLRGLHAETDDNRPAFPGDPDMDWEHRPERPHEPAWGLKLPH